MSVGPQNRQMIGRVGAKSGPGFFHAGMARLGGSSSAPFNIFSTPPAVTSCRSRRTRRRAGQNPARHFADQIILSDHSTRSIFVCPQRNEII